LSYYWFLNIPKISQKTFKRKIWLYDRGDYDKFKQYLSDVDWYSLISSNNVNDRTTNITNSILDAAELCIPSKIITVRKNQPQWLTSNIRKLIRKTNRIHRKARPSNSPSDWNKFRRIRNDVTNLVRKSKEEHQNNLIKKLINENSSGSNWWKTVKQLTGIKSRDHGIPPLVINDNLIFDDIEKANEFNIFFVAQSNIDDCNGSPPNEIQSLIENLEYIVLNEEEVEDVLKIINPSKTSGPDLINPRVLKEASSMLKNPLCKLYVLTTGYFSKPMKKS
jgi:hypothetical protein